MLLKLELPILKTVNSITVFLNQLQNEKNISTRSGFRPETSCFPNRRFTTEPSRRLDSYPNQELDRLSGKQEVSGSNPSLELHFSHL